MDGRYQSFNQLLYFDIHGDLSFTTNPNICGPASPNATTYSPLSGNDLGSSDAYPNYFLGLGNDYFQSSAQHELVRGTSIYLFAQDS